MTANPPRSVAMEARPSPRSPATEDQAGRSARAEYTRRKVVRGVTALWPLGLAEHVSAPGQYTQWVEPVADHLRAALPVMKR